MATNPFASEVAARLYAAGRPDYSDVVSSILQRLVEVTSLSPAVDVGCGTGISTRALSPLADKVIGVEPSRAMLDRAQPAGNVTYRVGSAESLPVVDASCDLIAVGSALHWFDQSQFLAEADRVAKPDAWLVVYDHWFAGEMQGNEDFKRWMQQVYLATYPSPPRDRSWRPPADLGEWRHTSWERYDHPVSLTREQLAAYLLTQSNLQTVIELGDETEEQLRSWLVSETVQFLANDTSSVFLFGGFVACHRRSP